MACNRMPEGSYFLLVWAVIAVLGLLAVAQAVPSPEELEQARYCEMVELHKTHGADIGWPDYNNNYDKVCNKDG